VWLVKVGALRLPPPLAGQAAQGDKWWLVKVGERSRTPEPSRSVKSGALKGGFDFLNGAY